MNNSNSPSNLKSIIMPHDIIFVDMDEVLVDISMPVFEYMLENKDIFENDYDLTPKSRKEVMSRSHCYIDEWLKKHDNKGRKDRILECIKTLDYSKLKPTKFAEYIRDYIRVNTSKTLYIISSCIEGSEEIKKNWIDTHIGILDNVIFLPVNYTRGQKKSEVIDSLGLKCHVFIDDDTNNIFDVARNTAYRIKLQRLFIMPKYEFNKLSIQDMIELGNYGVLLLHYDADTLELTNNLIR